MSQADSSGEPTFSSQAEESQQSRTRGLSTEDQRENNIWEAFSMPVHGRKKDGAKLHPTLAIPWTVACQALLGFSRQESWNGLLALGTSL